HRPPDGGAGALAVARAGRPARRAHQPGQRAGRIDQAGPGLCGGSVRGRSLPRARHPLPQGGPAGAALRAADKSGVRGLRRLGLRIEFRGVSRAYDGHAPVHEGLVFEVRRGQVVAVVAPAGAGKTTLVDLLLRFSEPKRGAILMDGVPITRFTRTSLRGLMGIVSQETILLNDTVLANISYGRSDFTLEQVQAAARAANAHDFVSQLPEGYRTLLGER